MNRIRSTLVVRRGRIAGALALALLLAASAWAAPGEVPPPQPPSPPPPPVAVDAGGSYTLPAGATHDGKLRLFKNAVVIAGKQDGDLWNLGGSLEIPGEVTGTVTFIGNSLVIAGKVSESVSVKAASVKLTGTIEGDLDARCGTVVLASGSRVGGDVVAYAGQITANGSIDGDLDASGGEVDLGGTVGKDASLEADLLKVAPEARVAGKLGYSARESTGVERKDLAGGTIDRNHVTIRVHDEHDGGVVRGAVPWFVFLVISMLTGLAALAVFSRASTPVLAAAQGDFLRNLGVGFLTFIVVPVAALVSCILILTIPFAVVALLVYALAVYLAKVPVAVWIGQRALLALGRPAPSRYASFAIGIVILQLLFAIPVAGWVIWFACAFLGLGAIVFGVRELWQARRARSAPPAAPPAAPQAAPAQPPPVV